jgi:hypothetical protein
MKEVIFLSRKGLEASLGPHPQSTRDRIAQAFSQAHRDAARTGRPTKRAAVIDNVIYPFHFFVTIIEASP